MFKSFPQPTFKINRILAILLGNSLKHNLHEGLSAYIFCNNFVKFRTSETTDLTNWEYITYLQEISFQIDVPEAASCGS